LLIAISTQAPNDADLFSIWIDDAKSSKDKHIVSHVYEAPKDCDLLDEAAWKDANPALGIFRSYEDLREQAIQAERMPSSENTFRNLCLNQRVEANNPFISKVVWIENGDKPESMASKKIYAGLDLSSVSDLTALVLVSEDGDVESTFWLPSEGLIDKSKSDRVPYDVWSGQGHLLTTPGRAIEYEYIADYIRGIFDSYNIEKIAFDRYNMKFLRPWLEKVGFLDHELEKFVEFGQGFVSMSPAIRELESKLLQKKLKHGNHPVLTMCAANATIVMDPAGNRKFTKTKSTGRIDGMVALAMAVGVMPTSIEQGDFEGFLLNPLAIT
jgi:phage terminase large subunit-like protein